MTNDPILGRPPGPRRHRRLFWAGVVVAVAVLSSGVVLAVTGYTETSGPAGAVRGYFAALGRADAPAALAFGHTPDGERTLLTGAVLHEQHRIAPLQNVSVTSTHAHGDTAQVDVDYTLAFPDGPQKITDTIDVRRVDGDWKLAATAVETAIGVQQAPQRASVLGAPVPKGSVLVFPGAVPIRFDSPYLEVKAASEAAVSFGSGPTTNIYVDVSAAGEKAGLAALGTALAPCLSGGTDPRCPQPTPRTIPGSMKVSLAGTIGAKVSVDVGNDPAGSVEVSGSVRVSGSYRSLGFDNRIVTRTGPFDLPVHASGYAVPPLRLAWVGPA